MSESLNTQQLRFDPSKATVANIEIVSFNVDDNDGKYKKTENDNFRVKFQYNIQYSKSDKIIIVNTDVDVKCITSSEEITDFGGRLIVNFYFKIENLNDYLTIIDGEVPEMNVNLAVNLVNVAYSTSRGLFFLKSRDTILENLILQIVNPMDLIKSQTTELM